MERVSSRTRAAPIIACFSDVGRTGTDFKSDLKHSMRLVPLVVPVKCKFFRRPTIPFIRDGSSATTTAVSICGNVNT